MLRLHTTAVFLFVLVLGSSVMAKPSLRGLIVEGQNNHKVWPKTTKMMKKYLEETGLFTVEVARSAPEGIDPNFRPEFSKYDVVVTNYHGEPWIKATEDAMVDYVKSGGGFVVIHSANNSFPKWAEYNRMIGLGGWHGRTEKDGPYVFFDNRGKLVRDTSKGPGGGHGTQHPFQIVVRDREHPITKGMPAAWMHSKDELYDRLRGPADNMRILATAYASKDQRGTGRHEPMIFTVNYGKGRVFHTPMGHGDYSQECVGFIVTFQRGTQWAATGKVTQSIPDDFPSADKVSARKYQE